MSTIQPRPIVYKCANNCCTVITFIFQPFNNNQLCNLALSSSFVSTLILFDIILINPSSYDQFQFLIINPPPGMYQEIHPCMTIGLKSLISICCFIYYILCSKLILKLKKAGINIENREFSFNSIWEFNISGINIILRTVWLLDGYVCHRYPSK